jgi:hypothetical protein
MSSNQNPFDPGKLDPKVLMELSQLVHQLPPEQLGRMQTLMHNMMAGFDVRREMEEFEKGLPPGFREKIMALTGPQMMGMGMGMAGGSAPDIEVESSPPPGTTAPAGASPASMDMREARLTILRAVADGRMAPEEAEKLL